VFAPSSKILWRTAAFAALAAATSGCSMVVMSPAGDVALQERNLILQSTGLMLLIIVPVMVLTAFFAWRYRSSNTSAVFDPDWHHSTTLEVVIWSAPLAIVIALGALTWISTHILDPYRPIGRLQPGVPVPASAKPLEVDVVALNWKWLFIYPSLGVASVNQLAAPVGRPLAFKITSSTMMNSFFIPALAGQIYAMPGMATQMHAVANRPGRYRGFSANYSGDGFSDMNFDVLALQPDAFQAWASKAQASSGALSSGAYKSLEAPSESDPVRLYGRVDPGLFAAIVGQCVAPAACPAPSSAPPALMTMSAAKVAAPPLPTASSTASQTRSVPKV
jgi:cytochrome o ubiquinol oxidase subunit 2